MRRSHHPLTALRLFTIEDFRPEITLTDAFVAPPWHGSSRAPFVCGGAQRGGSLAEVDFVGESTSNPLGGIQSGKNRYINQLRNHDLAVLDSFAKSTKSSLPNPLGEIHPTKSSQTEAARLADTPVLDPRFSSCKTGAYHAWAQICGRSTGLRVGGKSKRYGQHDQP